MTDMPIEEVRRQAEESLVSLRPALAEIFEIDVSRLAVKWDLSDPSPTGEIAMRFSVLIDGKDPTQEQQNFVTQLLRAAGGDFTQLKASA